MAGLALTLFGAPRVEIDGRPLRIERQKSLALLTYLAVDRQPHRRDVLAALLWPDSDQGHARASLRRILSSLHMALQHRWLSISDSIALPASEGIWIDVVRFRHLLATCEIYTGAEQLARLDEAALLYRGDFLSGFSLPDSPEYEEWQRTTTEDLRHDLSTILDRLSAGYASLDDTTAAIRQARRWVGLDPLYETAQRRLMELYAQAGQRAAARRQYEQFAQLLDRELGGVPALATTELVQMIHNGAFSPVAIPAFPSGDGIHTPVHASAPESNHGWEAPPVAAVLPHLHIRLLGGFTLMVEERSIVLNGVRLQSLLAYLLLHQQSLQSRQHLAFLFWPDTDEIQALSNLRNLLYKLRRALPEIDHFIEADAQMIQWRSDLPFTLDVTRFEMLAAHEDSVPDLEEAAVLYQGDLLPSCYDDWIQPMRSRLQQRAMALFERLLDLLEEARAYGRAIDYGQRLLQLDPLNESAYRRLMHLYALKGDQAAALRIYHICETTLQRELCVPPGPATQSLYEQLWSVEWSPPPMPTAPAALPLLGRDDEWRVLQRAWRNARNGRCQTVVLAGEAGIGKTRLAEELAIWVERQGFAIATAHCYAAEGALAYAPLVEWLRSPAIGQSLSSLDAIWLGEVARLLPELLLSDPHLSQPAPLTEGWQRQCFFEALARALFSRGAPLLLFLDDLQWCDPDMLEWIHYLLRYDPHAPLLLLAAMRSEEVTADHPVIHLLSALDRDSQLTEIVLGRLNAEVTAQVGSAVAGYPLPADEAAQLYQETEGNPLFVVEMVRARVETSLNLSAMQAPLANTGNLPPRVHKVIHSRLAQLSPGARDLASLAATIGREFTSTVLAAASELPDEDFVRYLDELWQRRILREKGRDGYDFSHDKLREVAYTSMSAAHRRLLHRRVAAALETGQRDADAGQTLDRLSGQIASHYEMAGCLAEAIRYYEWAAQAAQHLYANADAIRDYRRILDLLKQSGQSQVEMLAVYEKLSDLLLLTGQADETRTVCHCALSFAQGIERARFYRKIGNTWRQQHHYEKAQAAYADACRTLDKVDRRASSDGVEGRDAAWWQEWIQILVEIDLVYYWLGQVEESARLLAELAPAVEAWGSYSERASFFQHRALMTFRRNRSVALDETVADSSAALAAQYAAGGGATIPSSHFLLGFFILWHGEPDAAQIHLQRALNLAEQSGDITLQARCLAYLTIASRQLDAVDEVTAYAARSFAIANNAEMPEYMALARSAECWLAWRVGDVCAAREHGHAALSLWQRLPHNHASLPFKWTALWPLIDVAIAEDSLRTAIDYLHVLAGADQQRLPETLSTLIDEILLTWRRGDQASVRTQIEAAIHLAHQFRYL